VEEGRAGRIAERDIFFRNILGPEERKGGTGGSPAGYAKIEIVRERDEAMAVHNPARKLTYEDFVLFPEDGKRHEIIDGEHYVTPSPYTRHQIVAGSLHDALSPHVRRERLGLLLFAPVDVLLSPNDVLVPDLLFISNERREILNDKNVQGAPDLVVEILSESTKRRDKGIKYQRYEHFGVREYWLVDPGRRTVTVYRREADALRLRAEFTVGDVLETPLLPGLVLSLQEIFEY
jgi:Uma2 family endonuclease